MFDLPKGAKLTGNVVVMACGHRLVPEWKRDDSPTGELTPISFEELKMEIERTFKRAVLEHACG
jgi:hypothetical protein